MASDAGRPPDWMRYSIRHRRTASMSRWIGIDDRATLSSTRGRACFPRAEQVAHSDRRDSLRAAKAGVGLDAPKQLLCFRPAIEACAVAKLAASVRQPARNVHPGLPSDHLRVRGPPNMELRSAQLSSCEARSSVRPWALQLQEPSGSRPQNLPWRMGEFSQLAAPWNVSAPVGVAGFGEPCFPARVRIAPAARSTGGTDRSCSGSRWPAPRRSASSRCGVPRAR
jgi:hypothetical protein